ncbi:MAG: GDSL-type esterase/lipase family protein [Akkermansiaceae bacterium]|jgi:mono/diheme cytochrome c family protein/glucose/arabinose dehydrogenase|nr:GDSL-type esterase/lipase family protein [Akkermansiaceae bacterium]
MKFLLALGFVLFPALAHAAPKAPVDGERIVMIGNGLGERFLDHPWFETELHLRYPALNLVVRNLCRPGDTPSFRPHPSRNSQWAFPGADKFRPEYSTHQGNGEHPTPDQWLQTVQADTIFAFFGYNESFAGPEKLDAFKGELDAFITHTQAQKYNGESAPRLILVSPIAFEDLSAQRDLPDGRKENENLALYTQAMAETAARRNVEFVNLFDETKKLYGTGERPFTRNGFLPTDDGYRLLGPALVDAAFGSTPRSSKADIDQLAALVRDKDWFWTHDFRMPNGVHVDGRRYRPFGPDNYPAERVKIRAMTEVRDQAIHAAIQGRSFDLAKADAATPPLPEVKSNYAPSGKNGQPEYKPTPDALQALTTPEGYKVDLFVSEEKFPNLANPVQLSFDNRGRLWVATMPTYPHWKPGDPKPNDKLLIYEDTDNDGKADKEIVFADQLHLPIGFEFAPEGVYVCQAPHLMLLRDTNGDDKADSREVVITGFDDHDTHHAAGAFCADPSGAIYMGEGVFLHSNVETPYGPVRGVDGGFYRFSPQRTHLERTAQLPIPNPWGIAVDTWGQPFYLHTSGPAIGWMLPGSVKAPHGAKTPTGPDLAPQGNAVRPTSGMEFVSSLHFPEEVQGDMLLGNNIGFLGIKQHKIVDDGTGYKTEFRQNLLQSSDGNFRPVDLEFAPDGSLYVVDWQNMLIGHMQHNARDPHRDHKHGRIYRITYPSRPLVKKAEVAGAPLETLLRNLTHPDYRVRYRTRRELRGRPTDEVVSALKSWVAALDKASPSYEHHRLEALWSSWGMNRIDADLLREILKSPDFRARAAAVQALRYNLRDFPDHVDLLTAAANDEQGRVRLEAIIAGSWMDNAAGASIVAAASSHPLDAWSNGAAKAAADRLAGKKEEVKDEHPLPPIPARLTEEEKAMFRKGHEIYHRDGHCITCHQPDGKGLPPAGFPPLAKSPWVTGDPVRLTKLTLHGLMGPLELDGVKYPGQVPMTPFGGLLNDEEVASVLTYVRNHFGNEAPAITPAQVAEVRKATGTRGFYTTEEILKEHPLPPSP